MSVGVRTSVREHVNVSTTESCEGECACVRVSVGSEYVSK